mgnify:CR=1 FL=1
MRGMGLHGWVKIISVSLQSERSKEEIDSMIRELFPKINGVYQIESKKIWECIVTTDNGCLNILKKKRINNFDDFERWAALEQIKIVDDIVVNSSRRGDEDFWDNDDAVRNYYEGKNIRKSNKER